MHGRRLRNEGIAAWPRMSQPLATSAVSRLSVSSTTNGVGARGWARARFGVDLPSVRRRGAQGWRALQAIQCPRPLANRALARWGSAGRSESAASTQGTRFDPQKAGRLFAGYSVSVFRGRRLDLDVLPAAVRRCALLANSTPKRHRPHNAGLGALNFCLIKHLHDRAGEKDYRCEAEPCGH